MVNFKLGVGLNREVIGPPVRVTTAQINATVDLADLATMMRQKKPYAYYRNLAPSSSGMTYFARYAIGVRAPLFCFAPVYLCCIS